MVLVALGDDLEGEVGLRRVHRQHREIVDDQEVGTAVATECALELTVDLGAGEIATTWPVMEVDALVHHRHLSAAKWVALEDAWLLGGCAITG
jgi:hypothetical protein